MFTIEEYFLKYGKSHSSELTPEIERNAELLVKTISQLLPRIGIYRVKVTSGWRPPSVNRTVKNAATRSLHQIGLAVDFEDIDGLLSYQALQNHEQLSALGLYLEHPKFTPTWAHFDLGKRHQRKIPIFIP